MTLARTLVVAVCLLLTSNLSAEQTIYVSVDGDDSNSGTAEQPLASLAAARDAAVRLEAAEPVTVLIGQGTYYLREPLVFEPRHSGRPRAPVTFAARSAGEVVISGGVPLSDLQWEQHLGPVMKALVPRASIAHLEGFDQLLVNGVGQILARYPDFAPQAQFFNGVAADALSPQRVASWHDPTGGFLFAMHGAMWGDMAFRITGKDDVDSVRLEGGWQNNRPTDPHPQRRFVENVFEELDAPNEWFYDTTAETLYYYPPAGLVLSEASFVAAGLRHLVVMRGTSSRPVTDIRLQGLTITHAARTFMDTREPLLRSDWCIYRGGAILLEGAERCGVVNCQLAQLGGNAVFLSGYNRDCEVSGCLVSDIGASGICFVGKPGAVRSPRFNYQETYRLDQIDKVVGPRSDAFPAECRVHDCLITRTGRVEKQTAPVQISMARGITISHCSIYDVPRAGINISEGTWGGHRIEFCDVFDTVKETGDHGSFNSWGRDRFWHLQDVDDDRLGTGDLADLPRLDAATTTVIRDSRWRCDHGWDIDLDDGSTNYHIYNNLCLNGGIKNREGFYRVVENNIMVNNSFHPHVWYQNSHDVFRRNIVFDQYRPIRVPTPWGQECNDNLWHRPGQREVQAATALAEQSGRDSRSIVADARFIDPASGDYRVGDGSPALALGFVNFAMDRFGVVSPTLRERARTPDLPSGALPIRSRAAGRDSSVHEFLGAKVKNLVGLGEQSATGMHAEVGVLVISIPPGSEAARCGLQEYDVILALNGEATDDAPTLVRLYRLTAPGSDVSCTVYRRQKSRSVTVPGHPHDR